ncbi:MAG: RluA family pseudouridine synthase [Acidobacteria bacterium]|nr:RluA family pseudouridine synthase [Acidobacteriota bacterium]
MTPLNRGFEYRKLVGAEAAGRPVIDYLVRHFPAFTQEEWLQRIEAGRVLLDRIPVRSDQLVKPGQLLTWVRPPWNEPDVPRSYAILYRDGNLLAVAKPSGLPTLPGGGDFMDNTLLSLVRRHFPEANPVHRLGRGTSGIVLFALNKRTTRKMFQAWSAHKILKIYRALVSGCPDADDFDIDVPVGPVPHKLLKTVFAASPDGKPAHSRSTVLERRDSGSLVQVRITTGRPHQIRIHMAAAGYPLVGDPLYVKGGVPAPGSRARPSDLGYFLHNAVLGFPHPDSGEWIEVDCAPPPLLRCSKEMDPD